MFQDMVLQKKNLMPVSIKEEKMKYLFGLVTIWYILEDRRPDVDYGDDQTCSKKYKHQIHVCIFGKPVFSVVLHSPNYGFVCTNGILQNNNTSYQEIGKT